MDTCVVNLENLGFKKLIKQTKYIVRLSWMTVGLGLKDNNDSGNDWQTIAEILIFHLPSLSSFLWKYQ
jgi:hypothetical protein